MHATARVEARGKAVGVISVLQSYGFQESAQGSHLDLLSSHVHSPPPFASVGLGSSSAIEPLPKPAAGSKVYPQHLDKQKTLAMRNLHTRPRGHATE